MKTYDVVALGELLIDFTPHSVNEGGYPVLSANPGGAPGNFLAALNRYGCKTAMIGKVGNDTFGRLLVQTLQNAGIETKGVLMDDGVFTTLAFVSLDKSGNRDFGFARKPGADTCLKPSATRKAIELAKAHGLLISLDPNLRKPLWKNEADAKAAMEWSLKQADIVKISDEEIEFLWGLSPEEGGKKLLNEYGVSLAYITLGPKGCYAVTASHQITVNSPSGIQVIDTTGAGDIFGGSAMSQFLQYKKSPSDLTEEELTRIVRFACTAASLSTQKHGGITSVPTLTEVKEKSV